jgi:4-hydroxy-tetrahydrodipicolinate synthase
MRSSQINGVIPPLTTPFTRAGDIYEDGLRKLLDFQIEKGSHGVFLCGTYGSGPLMSLTERKNVVEIAVDQIKNRITTIVQVGTPSTKDVVELAKHAEECGVDAIGCVPPFYYRHDAQSVLEHFKQLVKAVEIPVYVYNNPKTSGFTVTPQILAKMTDLGVKGIKDSSFSLIEFSHFLIELRDRKDFTFIIGTEALAMPAILLGAKAVISGLANCFPEIVVDLYNATIKGDIEKAAKLQLRVNEARKILHIPKSANAACYAMLNERGIDVGIPRPPVLPVPTEEVELVKKEFMRVGLLKNP